MKPSLFFLLGFVLNFLLSCGNGPKLRIHISDPGKAGMEYYDEETQESGFTPYPQTDKFVCLTPTDSQTLLNYCGMGKQGNALQSFLGK